MKRPATVRLIMLSITCLDASGDQEECVCFRPLPTMRPFWFRKTIRLIPPMAQA